MLLGGIIFLSVIVVIFSFQSLAMLASPSSELKKYTRHTMRRSAFKPAVAFVDPALVPSYVKGFSRFIPLNSLKSTRRFYPEGHLREDDVAAFDGACASDAPYWATCDPKTDVDSDFNTFLKESAKTPLVLEGVPSKTRWGEDARDFNHRVMQKAWYVVFL
jgi:hypothetical protein